MNTDARNETIGLTEEECDVLRDWWDEDETSGVESSFPIIDRILTAAVEQERAAWVARIESLAAGLRAEAEMGRTGGGHPLLIQSYDGHARALNALLAPDSQGGTQ